ncbi:MAG: helix-turn-helix transcriptional regulator [Clostridia bacterium]|nr:helix-turn-helix transcriptional regulator [Clostridia bacterium]
MKNLRLKSARAAKDLSQADLAALCGVSRQTINAIEKGDYNEPSPANVPGSTRQLSAVSV